MFDHFVGPLHSPVTLTKAVSMTTYLALPGTCLGRMAEEQMVQLETAKTSISFIFDCFLVTRSTNFVNKEKRILI